MANLQLIIDAINNSSDELTQVKTDIGGIGTAADESKKPVDDLDTSMSDAITTAGLVVTAVLGVIETFELLYASAKKAAEIDLMEVKLDNLAGTIGTTGDALVNTLMPAVDGMSTKFQVSQAVVTALSTGLVTSEGDLLRMATASAGLGIPLTEMVDLMQNVSETKLTNAGIEMDNFTGKVKELTKGGMEKGVAEFEVAMGAIEGTIATVGSVADTTLGTFTKTENAVSDLGSAVSSNLTPSMAGLVGTVGDFAEITTVAVDANAGMKTFIGQLQGAVDSGAISQKEYNAYIRDMGVHMGAVTPAKLNAEMAEFTAQTGIATATVTDFNSIDFEDKEVTMTVDDSEVQNYEPPDKYGVVHYAENVGRGRAVGGPVTAGQSYNWQEYGYRGEVFVPSADGFVLSRADAERALANALYGGGSAVDPEAIGKAVAQALSQVTTSKKGGNVYNLTMPTSSNPADVRTAFELMEAWA